MAPNLLDYEHLISNIEDKEVFVIQHANSFPVKGKDFIMPAMVIAINKKGHSSLQYDRKEVKFHQNDVSIVLPNHIIKTNTISNDYDVVLIFISPSFIEDLRYRSLTYDYMKYHADPSCHLTEDQIYHLLQVVDVMKNLSEENISHKHDSLIYIVNIFFELLNNYRHEQDMAQPGVTRKNDLFNRFCDLLATHYTESKEVAFYADKLCLTPKYFSKLIRDVTNQSAGAWITNYVVTMSKQLLTTRPDLNIQNISYMLGFADQAAFSRYFRRATGMSPKRFKELDTK